MIEPRWRPSDFDEVSKDAPQLVGILDDGDDLHVRTALGTDHRIDLVNLCKKPGPGAFTCIDVDFFISI